MSTLLLTASALAATPSVPSIDPSCLEEANAGAPAGYDEQAQTDFIANHVALATTFSAIHGPIPHEPGHGALGAELAAIPPLGCDRRLVLGYSKTQDVNKTPVMPRIRVSYAFPKIGVLQPYAGLGYVPPIEVGHTTTAIVSGELGAAVKLGDFHVGGRFHATTTKSVGEISPPFYTSEPTVADLYVASTFGADLSMGMQVEQLVPYVSIGVTDASTYFYIGDDSVVMNNYHPYLGPVLALGVDGLLTERLRVGAELYAAPGGYSLPDPNITSVTPASRYGHLYTARMRVGVEL